MSDASAEPAGWCAAAVFALMQSGAMGCSSCGDRTGSSPPEEAGTGLSGASFEHARWPMPNPPSSGLLNAQNYDTSGFGTVIDRVTGLVWQRVVDHGAYSWSAAHSYCDGLVLGGYDDWRTPSMIELVSIADASRSDPAIDVDVFPNTPSFPFWSSQLDVGNSGLGWYVYFKNGGAYGGNDVVDPQRIRCVRSPALRGGGALAYVVANGTVHDPNTKLTWQQAIDPGSYAWPAAQALCSSISPGGSGWRLPSVNELMTLVDLTRVDPAIDVASFPGTPSDFFWSSSPSLAPKATAWGVSFNRGSAGASLVASASRVRCVR